MSEAQKIFASLSGAVVAHLLLLMLVFFLIGTRDIGASLANRQAAGGESNEVTILMGELMELVETESAPPAVEEVAPEDSPPEPETPEEPRLPEARPFLNTDLNAPESEAPENARFESDRNTRAASELPPEAGEAELDLPTTRGDLPFPYFSLENRRYLDGEFDRPPAPAGASAALAPAPPGMSERPGDPAALLVGETAPDDGSERGEGASAEASDRRASSPGREGAESAANETELPPTRPEDPSPTESVEPLEGVDTPPAMETAETQRRPGESPLEGAAAESLRERSYLLPESADSSMRVDPGNEAENAFAANRPDEVEAERGETADPSLAQAPIEPPGDGRDQAETVDSAPGRNAGGADPTADAGLFAPGFSPEQVQNATSGTLSNRGQNAVDAEGTPVGRYKKSVQEAIARKWHHYRHQHGEYVSWGVLKLECRVDSRGKVHGLRVVENRANAIIADFSLRAILDADLPPMPPEVAEELGIGGLQLKYDIIIY